LWKLNQRRHLIVHRSGIVDKLYNESTNDIFKLGREINMKPHEIKEQLEIVKTIGIKILSIK